MICNEDFRAMPLICLLLSPSTMLRRFQGYAPTLHFAIPTTKISGLCPYIAFCYPHYEDFRAMLLHCILLSPYTKILRLCPLIAYWRLSCYEDFWAPKGPSPDILVTKHKPKHFPKGRSPDILVTKHIPNYLLRGIALTS